MNNPLSTAAYCGLFCESCSLYIGTQNDPKRLERLAQEYGKSADEVRCNGCRSDKVSFYCVTCKIKDCICKKELNFCSECNEYPCSILTEFQVQRPHRLELFESLDYVKENGYECWYQKMKTNYSCERCGIVNPVYDFKCRKCGNIPPNPFVERNKLKIIAALQKNKKK